MTCVSWIVKTSTGSSFNTLGALKASILETLDNGIAQALHMFFMSSIEA